MMKKSVLKRVLLLPFGLLMLAGCSNDEEQITGGQPLKGAWLTASTEELTLDDEVSATRSYMSRDMKTHLWTTTDEMRVYDPMMVRYDIYRFSMKEGEPQTGAFSRVSEQSNYAEESTWALFSNMDIEGGYFERDRKPPYEPYLMARYRICADKYGDIQPMTYGALGSGSNALFTDWLPRWGQVTKVEGGEALHTSLKFLTGVLRLQLARTADKANRLRVQMLEDGEPIDIAGVFSTKLSINGAVQQDASLAADTYMDETGGDEIIVDLTGATGSFVVYVPLVTTTTPVDIVVSASKDGGTTWTEFKRFKDKTVTRGKVYGNSSEYVF